MFKVDDGCKLELQTRKTMKLFGSTKQLIGRTKNGENLLNLDVVDLVLVQCDLVDHQYQQNSASLHTFTANSYAYLLK